LARHKRAAVIRYGSCTVSKPEPASVQLHEKAGFNTIGTRKKIGQMNGVWRDTILLERRSKTIGI